MSYHKIIFDRRAKTHLWAIAKVGVGDAPAGDLIPQGAKISSDSLQAPEQRCSWRVKHSSQEAKQRSNRAFEASPDNACADRREDGELLPYTQSLPVQQDDKFYLRISLT